MRLGASRAVVWQLLPQLVSRSSDPLSDPRQHADIARDLEVEIGAEQRIPWLRTRLHASPPSKSWRT
jgi:hypothetical protein